MLGLVAVAQGASAADFRLVNRTNQAILTFQVEAQHQQDRYSGNWLSQPLLPGESRAITFHSDAHPCFIRHKMRFEGGGVRIGSVDICQATRLVVGENGRVIFYTD